MSDNRKISDEYTEIGNKLIQMMPELKELKESDVQIIFLASDAEKKSGGKIIFGQCEKVSEKYKWGIQCDFTITVFEPNVEEFSYKQIQILLFHELLHIGFNDKGDPYVRPHDLEDFKAIIDRYGTSWAEVDE